MRIGPLRGATSGDVRDERDAVHGPPAASVPPPAVVAERADAVIPLDVASEAARSVGGGGRRSSRPGLPAALVAADLVAAALAVHVAGLPVVQALALAASALVAAGWKGLYARRLSLSALDDAPNLLAAAAVATGGSAVAASLSAVPAPAVRAAAAALLASGVAALLRALVYAEVHRRRCRTGGGTPTLVVGRGVVGTRLADAVQEHPEYGLSLVGFLDQEPDEPGRTGPPLLGRVEELPSVLAATGARSVIVTFSSMPETELVDVLRRCDRLDCEIFLVPRLFELNQPRRRLDHVWGLPVVRLIRPAFRSRTWALKRAFDVVGALAALVLALPVLVVAAVLVRRETRAGVLFRQERVGLDGRPFQLLKLQTLVPADESESQTRWNIGVDHRVGPVGRWLRRTSVDELPQLWNVLRGDMSLVGPRPERPFFAEAFAAHFDRYADRHRVPVGVTGWAQVHGLRGDTSIAERAAFDNFYIEQWSLWSDVKILLRTVPASLRRPGC